MTSQKSLNNTFLYSFKTAFTESFIAPLAAFFGLLLLGPYTTYCALSSMEKSLIESAVKEGEKVKKLSDSYKYFFSQEFSPTDYFIMFIAIAAAIVMGVVLFRFISDKRTVNVYYSLGIKRSSLFISKYLSGLIMLTAAVALPNLLHIFVNIHFLGSSYELWAAGTVRLLGFLVTALFAYTFTGMVFSCVGTVIEGIAFSAVLLLFPTIVFDALGNFMSKFVWGSPYGNTISDTHGENLGIFSLSDRFFYLNPISFGWKSIIEYQVAKIQTKTNEKNETITTILNMREEVWSAPSYKTLICWLIVTAAFFALGVFLFKRRKTEICGFRGSSKTLNAMVTFSIGFFAFSNASRSVDYVPVFAAVLIAIAAYITVYIILELILNKSKKAFAKGLIKLPVHAGIITVIAVIVVTGMFGYSNRLPDASDIKSVKVSQVSSPSLINENHVFRGTLKRGLITKRSSFMDYAGAFGNYTSEKDKNTILALNKSFIDLKDKSLTEEEKQRFNFAFVYTLNDGSEVIRHYSYASKEILDASLELAVSDYYNEFIKQAFTAEIKPLKDEEYDKINSSKERSDYANTEKYSYDAGLVSFISPNLDKLSVFGTPTKYGEQVKTNPDLAPGVNFEQIASPEQAPGEEEESEYLQMTKEQHTALKTAIYKDLTRQTAQQRNQPSAPALGVIKFSSKRNAGMDSGYMYSGYHFSGDDITLTNDTTTASIIYVTPDMTNTVEFLKANDFYKYFIGDNTVVSAHILSINDNYGDENYSYGGVNSNIKGEFVACLSHNVAQRSKEDDVVHQLKNKLTKPEQVKELSDLAQLNYYLNDNGYYCIFELSDGSYVTKYLPEKSAPDYVKVFAVGTVNS